MRKTVLLLFLLVFCLPFALGQKTRFGQEPPRARPGVDYPIKVHISGIHVRFGDPPCGDLVYADATLNEKKVEFVVWTPGCLVVNLVPGDYQARFMKPGRKGDPTPLYQEYELPLPDMTICRCTVS